MFLEDLSQSTEIVITNRNKVRLKEPSPRKERFVSGRGSGRRVLIGVARMGSAFNAAVTGKRMLSRTESASLLKFGVFISLIAFVAFYFPKVIAYMVGLIIGWTGLFTLIKSARLRWSQEEEKPEEAQPQKNPSPE